jgi:hypothetical protein
MTETRTDDGLVKISDGPKSTPTTPIELTVPEVVRILEFQTTLLTAINAQLKDVCDILKTWDYQGKCDTTGGGE